MSLICRSLGTNPLVNNSLITRISSIGLSQWSPQHALPVREFDRIEDMVSKGELTELAFKPIRARPAANPCSLFYNHTLNRFLNKAHIKGQKALIRDLMRQTFAVIKRTQIEKYNNASEEDRNRDLIECNPYVIFETAIENCRPLIVTKPVKRGGATYQVPYALKLKESEDLAIRWIIHTVRERPKPRNIYFPEAMAKELIEAFYNEGKIVKKKQDVHRLCEANRAYAHYRWG